MYDCWRYYLSSRRKLLGASRQRTLPQVNCWSSCRQQWLRTDGLIKRSTKHLATMQAKHIRESYNRFRGNRDQSITEIHEFVKKVRLRVSLPCRCKDSCGKIVFARVRAISSGEPCGVRSGFPMKNVLCNDARRPVATIIDSNNALSVVPGTKFNVERKEHVD